jgi:hypothetical protein
MGVGGVDGGDGDGEEKGEQESSEGAGGELAGVGVASFDSGRNSKPALGRVAITVTLALALALDARRAGFFADVWERDDGAYL